MNYCFYCGVKDATSRSNHKIYASSLDTAQTYYRNTEKEKAVYYCDTCAGWYTKKHTDTHPSGSKVMPLLSSKDTAKEAYYFYTRERNAADTKWVYSKIVAKDLVHSINSEYYWKDGDSYKRIYYCETCDRWFNNKHKHATDGTITWGTQYYPEESVDYQISYEQFYKICEERETALREALNLFIEDIEEASAGENGIYGDADDVKHRLALVGFGSDVSSANDSPASCEILTVDAQGYNNNRYPVWYNLVDTEKERNAATGTKYLQDALRDVTTEEGRSWIDYALSEYVIKGNTWTDHGMQLAQWILEKSMSENEQRNKVVVLFTDGAPYKDGDGYFGNRSKDAIFSAKIMKKDLDATIYGIGVFSKAKSSLPAPDYVEKDSTTANTTAFFNRCNRFMHLVSSNYPDASNEKTSGAVNPVLLDDQGNYTGDSFYLAPDTTDALNDVFKQIASSVTSGGAYIQELNEKTIIRDVVSNYFKISENSLPIAYTMSYAGNDNAGNKQWIKNDEELNSKKGTLSIDVNGKVVQVTDFNFKEYYVALDASTVNGETTYTPRGKKLIIEIPIEIDNASALNLPTNDEEKSGIFTPTYDESGALIGERLYENFDLPHADLFTDVSVTKMVEGGLSKILKNMTLN